MPVPTQNDIDLLDIEISKVRTISATSFGDQSTSFRSLKELEEIRARMIREMNAADNSNGRVRLGATSKGF